MTRRPQIEEKKQEGSIGRGDDSAGVEWRVIVSSSLTTYTQVRPSRELLSMLLSFVCFDLSPKLEKSPTCFTQELGATIQA